MIKLYGTRNSRAFRCLWALEESHLEYELVPVDWQTGETRTPDFLALNPNGHVPVFQHEDLILVESLAINIHISQLAQSALTLRSSMDLTHAVQWTIWAMGELEGPHDAANRKNADVDERLRTQALNVLNRHLTHAKFLTADRFSVSDLNVACVLMRPKFMPFVSDYERLHDWFNRCASRPALAKALGR
ncbi:MAG: glutathione S-transferase [Pseudomonadota bacterium]